MANRKRAQRAFWGAIGLAVCPIFPIWYGLFDSALASEPAEPGHCAPQVAPQVVLQDTPASPDPPQELTTLVTQLMLDLPSYGNRVIQRAGQMGDETQRYLITTGQAEVEPVAPAALAAAPNQSQLPEPSLDPRSGQGSKRGATAEKRHPEEIYQVFFTTLERQYLRPDLRSPLPSSPGASQSAPERAIAQALDRLAPSQQQFHWLILARQRETAPSRHFGNRPTTSPWRIISLRSKLAPYPAEGRLLSPERNSRQGPVGQGIVLWLRDWHSGVIRPDHRPANGLSCPQ